MNFGKVKNNLKEINKKFNNIYLYYFLERRIQFTLINTILLFILLVLSVFIDHYLRSTLFIKLNLYGLLVYFLSFIAIFLLSYNFLCGSVFLLIENSLKSNKYSLFNTLLCKINKLEFYIKDKIIIHLFILIVIIGIMKSINYSFLFMVFMMLIIFNQLGLLFYDLHYKLSLLFANQEKKEKMQQFRKNIENKENI